MSVRFSILFILLFLSKSHSQINNDTHYSNILSIPIDQFLIDEVRAYGDLLILNDYQQKKVKEKAIIYYVNLRKLDDATAKNTINKEQRLIRWNFAEYIYLKKIKAYLRRNQVALFEKHFFPKIKEETAKSEFNKSKIFDSEN